MIIFEISRENGQILILKNYFRQHLRASRLWCLLHPGGHRVLRALEGTLAIKTYVLK